MSGPSAAVFDLDGVVTFTARVHEAAWKDLFDAYLRARADRTDERFRPFESADYRTHVDGRPRYEGVREFLASRDITLPQGAPTDPPDRETICGIGNRKDELFRARLDELGVEVDAQAVRLIAELKRSGVPVGLASSSKNVAAVLERADLDGLFDTRVDGVLSERLGLPGKPAPDLFLKCLERLGEADPARALVVEDAGVGVAAGRAGGFGMVMGVDRGGQRAALREHGADWVTADFADVSLERIAAYFEAREHRLPNALTKWGELRRKLGGKRLAVFLDYDGTLTPIADRPELATLGDEMRTALLGLAEAWPTVIVSGRGLEDVRSLVGLEHLTYAGSHGFDVAGPTGSGLRHEVDPEIVPLLAEVFAELSERIAAIPGALVESKKFSLAVHYRLVPDARIAEVESAVDEALATRTGLRKAPGKKVFEVRPAREWDKGRAVLWLMDALELDRPDVVPLYVGDDVTDEDALRAIEGRGVGIIVMDVPRPTAARFALQDVEEVRLFFERLIRLADQEPDDPPGGT